MLSDRIEAEMTYAMRLQRISESSCLSSFSMGKLKDEVDSFKSACSSRANQAAEVYDNVTESCITPLKELLDTLGKDLEIIFGQASKQIDRLQAIDRDIKQTAFSYFKAAREAEEGLTKYSRVKYAAESSF